MNEELNKYIEGIGALIESTKIVYDAALSSGFDKEEAFSLSEDFFNQMIIRAINKKNN